MARDMKFATVNMDLVFGLPGQTSKSIKNSVAMIAELAPDMLVCQQYTRRPQQFPHQAALDDDAMPTWLRSSRYLMRWRWSRERGLRVDWVERFVRP